jgi:hypothetical protein
MRVTLQAGDELRLVLLVLPSRRQRLRDTPGQLAEGHWVALLSPLLDRVLSLDDELPGLCASLARHGEAHIMQAAEPHLLAPLAPLEDKYPSLGQVLIDVKVEAQPIGVPARSLGRGDRSRSKAIDLAGHPQFRPKSRRRIGVCGCGHLWTVWRRHQGHSKSGIGYLRTFADAG